MYIGNKEFGQLFLSLKLSMDKCTIYQQYHILNTNKKHNFTVIQLQYKSAIV